MGIDKALARMAVYFREPVNGLTHFIAMLLSFMGLGLLMWKTSHPFNPLTFTACTIFGLGLILLYGASTLYHWLPVGEKGIGRLRRLDHTMIFVLIASSYTPFCLGPFRGTFGWSMLGTVWAIAVTGIVFKLFWIQAPRWISTLIYVFMGWIAVAGIGLMVRVMEPLAIFWLFSGGVFYSVGAVIYAFKKPNLFPGRLGFHEIFHIFVMLGSSSHFWAVYRYVAA